MKRIIIIATSMFLIFFNSGCKEEAENNNHNGSTIMLTKIKNYFPFNLFESKSMIVFKNENGDLKNLKIYFDRRMKKIKDYNVEDITITLKENSPINTYSIVISASINDNLLTIDSNNKIEEFLTIMLLSTINNGYIPVVDINERGNASVLSTQKLSQITLAAKQFFNVYTNIKIIDSNRFDEIYYTIDQGIVGFNDENGAIWALHGYE